MLNVLITNFLDDFKDRLKLFWNVAKSKDFILPILFVVLFYFVGGLLLNENIVLNVILIILFLLILVLLPLIFFFDTFISYLLFKYKLFNIYAVARQGVNHFFKLFIDDLFDENQQSQKVLKKYIEEMTNKIIDKNITNQKILNFLKSKILKYFFDMLDNVLSVIKIFILKVLNFLIPSKNYNGFFHKYLQLLLNIFKSIGQFIIKILGLIGRAFLKFVKVLPYIALGIAVIASLLYILYLGKDLAVGFGNYLLEYSGVLITFVLIVIFFGVIKSIFKSILNIKLHHIMQFVMFFISSIIFFLFLLLIFSIINSITESILNTYNSLAEALTFNIADFIVDIAILLIAFLSIVLLRVKLKSVVSQAFTIVYFIGITILMYSINYLFLYFIYLFILSFTEHKELKLIYFGLAHLIILVVSYFFIEPSYDIANFFIEFWDVELTHKLYYSDIQIMVLSIFITFLIVTDYKKDIKMLNFYLPALKGRYKDLRKSFK